MAYIIQHMEITRLATKSHRCSRARALWGLDPDLVGSLIGELINAAG